MICPTAVGVKCYHSKTILRLYCPRGDLVHDKQPVNKIIKYNRQPTKPDSSRTPTWFQYFDWNSFTYTMRASSLLIQKTERYTIEVGNKETLSDTRSKMSSPSRTTRSGTRTHGGTTRVPTVATTAQLPPAAELSPLPRDPSSPDFDTATFLPPSTHFVGLLCMSEVSLGAAPFCDPARV